MVTQLACFSYGAGHKQEGLCLRVDMGSYRILLDCGLRDLSPCLSPDCPADVVICSHAHGDHARGLLGLHQQFRHLPIYASEVTTHLLPLNWPEVSVDPSFCQALPWRSPIQLHPSLSVELFPAGHLPGAAAIVLTYQPQQEPPARVLYTGDFFLSHSRLVEALRLDELRGLAPDVLIVEASYGLARYPRRRQQESRLMERLERELSAGRSILLPVPLLGVAQELLFLLRSHHLFTGRDVDIWVEAAIADACDQYLDLLPHFPNAVQNFARHQALFWDDRIRPRTQRLQPQQIPHLGQAPAIVLSYVRSDWSQFCHQGDWLILLPEHLEDSGGWLPPTANHAVSSRATVTAETYLLAEHSDLTSTLQLIHTLRPQHLVLVHGLPQDLVDLANLDELHNRYKVHTPSPGRLIELPIGQPATTPIPAEIRYEAEVAEIASGAIVTLPNAILRDPRWQTFADTGLLEAYWRGEELLLRGLSQHDLLGSVRHPAALSLRERSCFHCQFYRDRRCTNPDSPLFQFQVTPDGCCPVFQPQESDRQ
jgi:Cft2 family RNA processing exonuclease